MLAVPLPFIVAVLLAVMLAMLLLRAQDRPLSVAIIAFLSMAIIQLVIVGLRWTYDLPPARILLPITASTLPPLAWMTVDALRQARRGLAVRWLPPAAIVGGALILVVLHRPAIQVLGMTIDPIDLYLLLVDLGYGLAILAVARRSPDGLDLARLGDATATQQAVLGLGSLLVFNAVVDGFIAANINHEPNTVGAIISVANLVVLAAAAGATVLIGRGASSPPSVDAAPVVTPPAVDPVDATGASESDAAVLATVDALLRDRALYRDPDLTLDRLARRAGLPARAISVAINRVHRMNVSQYVNGFRVAEAQALLRATDRPVTAILFDVGFQTKSNFNREFRRVTGCAPSDWRGQRETA